MVQPEPEWRRKLKLHQLRKLTLLQARYEQAETARRAAVIETVAQGVPITHVADALGVNRVTVHRWIRDQVSVATDKERPGAVRAARGTTAQGDDHAQHPEG